MIAIPSRFYDASAAATDRRAGFYQTYVLRPLSLPLSPALFRAGVSGNQATALGAMLGVTAAIVATLGGYLPFVIAALVRHLAVVMDFVDGNLARAHGRKTWAGKYFDGLNDALLDGLFLIGVGVGLGGLHTSAAGLAAWLYLAGMFARVRYLYVGGACAASAAAAVPPAVSTADAAPGVARRIVSAFDRVDQEITLPLLVPAALLGRLDLWLVVAAAMRGAGGLLNLAGAVYRAAADLDVPRA